MIFDRIGWYRPGANKPCPFECGKWYKTLRGLGGHILKCPKKDQLHLFKDTLRVNGGENLMQQDWNAINSHPGKEAQRS